MGRDGHRNGRTGPVPPHVHLDLGTGSAGAALLFHVQLLGKEHPEEGPGWGKRRSLEVGLLRCLGPRDHAVHVRFSLKVGGCDDENQRVGFILLVP